MLRSWRCVRECMDPTAATAGSLVRVRGRALERTYEVVFLGAAGEADDVATAPRLRTRRRVDVRVPLGAAAGPLLVAQHDGPQSSPSEAPLAVSAASALQDAHAGPSIDVQVQSRRAFFDAARPAKVSYVLHGDAPARALIEQIVLDGSDRKVTLFVGGRTWDALYDVDGLRRTAQDHPWLTVVPVVEEDGSRRGAETGTLGQVVSRYAAWADRQVVVSGSPAMVRSTVAAMIEAGRRSKCRSTSCWISASSIRPVPNDSTEKEIGRAIPMPYAISTSKRSASPAATTFFATQRAAYAPERSTLVGSFPENAPPPWRAMPP